MRIFVCVKAVPDTNANLKVGSDNLTINPQGVKYVMSPYDAVAASKAVELKAANEGSELIALSVGKDNKESRQRIKDALALGADRGVFIKDDAAHRDPLGVAKALVAAIKAEESCDLVFFGRQAVDTQASAVGPMVAQLLDIPFVMDCISLEIADGKATVKRSAEGRVETLEVSLPAAFSAQRGLAEERYAKLKDIMKAKKKPQADFDYAFPDAGYEVTAMTPPPERPAGKIVGEGPEAVGELLRLLQDEAKSLSF
ncbi:MAG: electron transfer flavoprotein subunit beta/FixA family protein [Planctomycetota bacterium]|nr:electron transfer flavoprotein subunit beta/FixA family protein [Planctomycetota bacterium]